MTVIYVLEIICLQAARQLTSGLKRGCRKVQFWSEMAGLGATVRLLIEPLLILPVRSPKQTAKTGPLLQRTTSRLPLNSYGVNRLLGRTCCDLQRPYRRRLGQMFPNSSALSTYLWKRKLVTPSNTSNIFTLMSLLVCLLSVILFPCLLILFL